MIENPNCGWNVYNRICPVCGEESLSIALMNDYNKESGFKLDYVSIYCTNAQCEYDLPIAKNYVCKQCCFYVNCISNKYEVVFKKYSDKNEGCNKWVYNSNWIEILKEL